MGDSMVPIHARGCAPKNRFNRREQITRRRLQFNDLTERSAVHKRKLAVHRRFV